MDVDVDVDCVKCVMCNAVSQKKEASMVVFFLLFSLWCMRLIQSVCESVIVIGVVSMCISALWILLLMCLFVLSLDPPPCFLIPTPCPSFQPLRKEKKIPLALPHCSLDRKSSYSTQSTFPITLKANSKDLFILFCLLILFMFKGKKKR